MMNLFWNHSGVPLLLIVLAACFIIPTNTSVAQTVPTVEWGELVVTPSNYPLYGWTYWYEGKAYLQFGPPRVFRLGYNDRLEYEERNPLIQAYANEGQAFVEVVYTQKKSWVFTQIYKQLKKELTLYVQPLDEVESGKGYPVQLLPTFDLKRSEKIDISVKSSADSSKILVALQGFVPESGFKPAGSIRKLEQEVFFLYVFDESMNLLTSFTPKAHGALFMDYEVNNDGDVFALAHYSISKASLKSGTIELLHLKSGRTVPQYSNIPLEVSSFTRLKLKVLDNGDLFISGIYFEDDYPGVFSFLIDPFAVKIVHQSNHQFSWPWLRSMREDKRMLWEQLTVKEIIQISEGETFVIAGAPRKGFYVLGFEHSEFAWLHYFPGNSDVHFATMYNGKLHLLFVGNIKNMDANKRHEKIYDGYKDLIWAAIQPDGELTYQVVEQSNKSSSSILPLIGVGRCIEGYPGKIWIYARGSLSKKHQAGLVTLPLN
jgi:hypothetical protein